MKYIKAYENKTLIKKYWLVPTDYRLEQSLIEIGCPLDGDGGIDMPTMIHSGEYAFILFYHDVRYMKDWAWNQFKGNIKDEYSEKHNYIFQGIVGISDVEIDAWKYNL